jgi:hypothetical protein
MASGDDVRLRIYKAGAVVIGYLSHLMLDEIYSVTWRLGVPRLKSSFGTAMKLFGQSGWANLSTYGKLALLSALIFYEPQWSQMPQRPGSPPSVQQSASHVVDSILQR